MVPVNALIAFLIFVAIVLLLVVADIPLLAIVLGPTPLTAETTMLVTEVLLVPLTVIVVVSVVAILRLVKKPPTPLIGAMADVEAPVELPHSV